MDEERLRMRRELVRQARQGKTNKKTPETKSFFIFRIYVTMMLVGAVFVLSFFDTNTTNTITESLKEAIAYEMPLETVQEWKQKVVSVFQQNANKIQNKQQQDTQQDIQQQNIQQDIQQQSVQQQDTPQQNTTEQKTNLFQPDLNENTGKIP